MPLHSKFVGQTLALYSSATGLTMLALGLVPAITLGTPTTTQTVSVQMTDADGNAVAGVRRFRGYFCTDTAGATPSATGAGAGVTATTGVILKANTAKLDFDVLTDATGLAVLLVNAAGGGVTYADKFAVLLMDGFPIVSAALAATTA